MIGQLFQNLLANAVKFHGEASPVIRVAAGRQGRTCQITVEDNGIGIPPRDQNRIFDAFERLDADRRQPGTGIGLAICKKIVQRHEGRIWVKSEPGRGTTVHVELAAAATPQPARV